MLPLLSHALDEAWRSRVDPNVLTLSDYERVKGIEGAVQGSAEQAYNKLTPTQQAVARQVFLRLTTTTADSVDTADRVDRDDLVLAKPAKPARMWRRCWKPSQLSAS